MSGRPDMVSSSPDRPVFQNGMRGSIVSGASLERFRSFRESGENQVPSSAPSTSRANLAMVDPVNLLTSLASDFRAAVVDNKTPRMAVARTLSSISGRSMFEDIKHARSDLHDSAMKARERGRIFGGAISKISRYHHNPSRKRSRTESSQRPEPTILSGGNLPKNAHQLHSGKVEVGHQKSEEKTKNVPLKKRVRTTAVDIYVDRKGNGIPKASTPQDKAADVTKNLSGNLGSAEERDREFATKRDGWEKPMTKKRRSFYKLDPSAGALLASSSDGDLEAKQGAQHKVIPDSGQRGPSFHGSRSGTIPNGSGVGKHDPMCMQNGSTFGPSLKSCQDVSIVPTNKQNRVAASEKERGSSGNTNKPLLEDDLVSTNASFIKLNGSARGPRSSSASLSKASQNTARMQGSSDDWDNLSNINKMISVGRVLNLKSSNSIPSPSLPMAQWGGQRPQKISRMARRSNMIPLVVDRDEIPVIDPMENGADEGPIRVPRRASSNAPQRKKKLDEGHSLGLSDIDGFLCADNKPKKKGMRTAELDDNDGPTVRKIVPPGHLKKNRASPDKDFGENTRKRGRVGRVPTPTRFGVPSPVNNMEPSSSDAKQRSAKIVPNPNERKPGKLSSEKCLERKGERQLPSQLNDDHEELLAAARAVLDTRYTGESAFWKDMEPVFSFLSAEDISFVRQQDKPDCGSPRSLPLCNSKDAYSAVTNGLNTNESDGDVGVMWQQGTESSPDKFSMQKGVSIFGMLVSALINEEEFESAEDQEDGYLSDTDANGRILSKEEGWESNSGVFHDDCFDPLEVERCSLGSFKSDSTQKCCPEFTTKDKPNLEGVAEDVTLQPEFHYAEMCINDRILHELGEIGLRPESVPGMAHGEDRDISEEICNLESELHEKVMWRKNLLPRVEKAVIAGRESQQRELPGLAMDKLVLAAYDSYMAAQPPHVSMAKNMSKACKLAIQFVERTLLRCSQYEETGVSCFHKPPFKDMFLLLPSWRCDEDAEPPRWHQTPRSQVERVVSSVKHDLSDMDTSSSMVKKREMFLGEVVGSITGSSRRMGSVIGSSAKGKRSGRDRDGKGQTRAGIAAAKRDVPLNCETEPTTRNSARLYNCNKDASSGPQPISVALEVDPEPVDLSYIQPPDIDVGNGQEDISTWLNIDDDGLDFDLMGLEIPMDDLSDVKLMI